MSEISEYMRAAVEAQREADRLRAKLAAARDAALEEAALLVEAAAGYWPPGLRVAVAIRARKGTGR